MSPSTLPPGGCIVPATSIEFPIETEAELAESRRYWLEAGADEVLFNPYATWPIRWTLSSRWPRRPFGTSCDSGRSRASCSRRVSSSAGTAAWCPVAPITTLTTQTLMEIRSGEAYQEMRRRELDGTNDSPLFVNCNQAPGQARTRLWPMVRRR